MMGSNIFSDKVDITPDRSLIRKLGASGYRIFQAIGELTDNSIDARILDKKLDLHIKLAYADKTISVIDNAKGMDKDTLKNALTLAKSDKTKDDLGRFGLGLKTACSSLGQKFTIITRPIGSKKEFVATYDEAKWINSNESKSKKPKDTRWKILIEERPSVEIQDTGTIVKIEKLRVKLYPTQTNKAAEYFGKRYAPLIEKKMASIHINSRLCSPITPKLKQKEDFKLTLSKGTISGWIGLKSVASIVGDYGFNLYNNGRLVSFNDKSFFPQHPSVARVVGDLNLDYVPTNFTKTEFLKDSPEYLEAKRFLPESEKIRLLLQEARKTKFSSEIGDQTKEKLYGEVKITLDLLQKLDNDFHFDYTEQKVSSQLIISKNVSYGKENYSIKVYLVGKSSYKTFFTSKKSNEIIIEINLNSPFFFSFKNKTLPINIVLADAISGILDFKDSLEKQDFRDKLISASFVTIGKEKLLTKEDVTIKPKEMQDNSGLLSENLLQVYEIISDKFGNSFYFTGTSVLEGYQNNLPAVQYYFIYCNTGLIKPISKATDILNNEFLILENPTKDQILDAIKNSKLNKVIILREKQRDIAELREGSVASIETAFVDLYFEIKHEQVPIVESEIKEIFESIMSSGEINLNKIRRRALKRKVKDRLEETLGRIL